jgi:hypothetical protein
VAGLTGSQALDRICPEPDCGKIPAIRVVDLIDAKTPDGTVGVIGFFLLVTGFLLQMYGAYLGGQLGDHLQNRRLDLGRT